MTVVPLILVAVALVNKALEPQTEVTEKIVAEEIIIILTTRVIIELEYIKI